MKILIIDDHPLYRDGLASLLGQVFPDARIDQAGDVPTAFGMLARDDDVDLALLDLEMPGLDGRGALPDLRRRHPALPVVVISVHEDPVTIAACLDAGASGYIPKSARREVLSAALTVVADGGIYLPPALKRSSGVSVGASQARIAGLTQRQREVLLGVCAGEPNKAIARRLAMSEATVRAHLGAVYRALGVSNRTQAALAARRLGLCDVQGGVDA